MKTLWARTFHELFSGIAQCCSEPFFKRGMVEGQLKGVVYGHVRLDACSQKVRKMFGLRRDHFRPEDPSRRGFGIESQNACVTPLKHGPGLLPEVNVSDNDARVPQSREGLTDNGTLGIAEHNAQRCAAAITGRGSIRSKAVTPCDETFIQCLMQDRGVPVGISGKVNRKIPDL